MRPRLLPILLLPLLAACASDPVTPVRSPEEVAPPKEAEILLGSRQEDGTNGGSTGTGALAYVAGGVVTDRDVLLRIGPQLQTLARPEDREQLWRETLHKIVRERILYRNAQDAGVDVSREEIEAARKSFADDLARQGGTFDAYLNERGMSAQEFDRTIRQELANQKFLMASIGGGRAGVLVRQRSDTFVNPEEIRTYFERNRQRFHERASAAVRVLAVKTDLRAPDREAAVAAAREIADSARSRIAAGEDFAYVFREVQGETSDPDPLDGLITLYAGERTHAEWIEEFAFASERGTLSEVLQKGSTFYLLHAEGARPERDLPFEEVQASLKLELERAKRRAAAVEVELQLLSETSVKPEDLAGDLRTSLRSLRRKMLQEYGL